MTDVPPDPLAKPPPSPIGITEDAAKTLWCPFTPRQYDADGKMHNANCCITGQCMFWHWDVSQPNSNVPLGWCSLCTLAPGEDPLSLRTEPEPGDPQLKHPLALAGAILAAGQRPPEPPPAKGTSRR